jgi:hypothetical protein
MAGPDVKSESVDLMKLLQQVSAQLSQITQGTTTGQMSGQRRDSVDAQTVGQDVGADEMKALAGGISSTEALRGVDLVDERQHKAAIRQLTLQTLQNAIETANMVSKQAVSALSKGAENLLGINATDAIEASMIAQLKALGYEVAKK